MTLATFEFTRWRRIVPYIDEAEIQKYLKTVGEISKIRFKQRMDASRGGKTYTKELRWVGGRIVPVGPRLRGVHTASKPGDFPANDTGKLRASINYRLGAREVEVGSNTFYAKYLREGTPGGLIKKRKMSPDALKEGMAAAGRRPFAFAKWRLG